MHRPNPCSARVLTVQRRAVFDDRRRRFEQHLFGLAAAGTVATAIETLFDHDRASIDPRWMWTPDAIAPAGAVAETADIWRRMGVTTFPAVFVTNVAQGSACVQSGDSGIDGT